MRWTDLNEEAISHRDYDLSVKFDHFNRICFGGQLPKIPCVWKKIKRATGLCHMPFTFDAKYAKQPKLVRAMHGRIKWEGVYIALDRQYLREEKDIDAILVHEMIHAWFAYQNDLLENHGAKFMAKLKQCEEITGLKIPVTENVTDLEVSDDVAQNKPFVVMIVERGNDLLYAMMSPMVYQRIAHTTPDMMRRLMRGSKLTLFSTSSKAWNRKAMSAKVQRPKSFPNTTLYYLKTPELLDDLKASGKVLFTGDNLNESISPALMKYVRGQCYDFALALLERFPEGQLVSLGKSKFGADHVGIKVGDHYLDARGAQTADQFVAPFNYQVSDIEPIDRDDVEFFMGLAGVAPPYKGNADIAAARKAVKQVFRENADQWVTVYHGHQDEHSEDHEWKFFTTDKLFADEYGWVTTYQIRLGHVLDTTDQYTVENYILPIEHPYHDVDFETWSDYADYTGETWEIIEDNLDDILARYPEHVDTVLITEQGCVNYIVRDPKNVRVVQRPN